MSAVNKMTGDFSNKPSTQAYFVTISRYIESLGPVKKEVKSQVSYAVNRKFIWLWVYDKTPDGILYLTVCLDRKIDDPQFHTITQVSKNRWNHHVEVRSESNAASDWLHRLIQAGYDFAKS